MAIMLILPVIVLIVAPWPHFLVRTQQQHARQHVLQAMLMIGFVWRSAPMDAGATINNVNPLALLVLLLTYLTYVLACVMMGHTVKMPYVFQVAQVVMLTRIPEFVRVLAH